MDFSMIVMTIIVVTLGSLGIAGIPGTATMAASVGLSGVQLCVEEKVSLGGPTAGGFLPVPQCHLYLVWRAADLYPASAFRQLVGQGWQYRQFPCDGKTFCDGTVVGI